MIEKYTRPRMGRIWSTEHKYECWLRVEVAVAEAWAAEGRVPEEALPSIRDASFDLARVAEIEKETQHDVIAFIRNLSERVGPDARWIHLGLTSSDVVDTGLALQLVESVDVLTEDTDALLEVLGRVALCHRNTPTVGRTHNVHAEPMTFGFKLAVWYAEMQRHRARLGVVREEIGVAKISGAVGTHANVTPRVEERVARRLGLQVEPVSTQVVQRDRHASYVLLLGLIASSLDKMATELRNLQHTEILEVEEPFRTGQQGSSAMPHKRNPILNERISGLARVVRGYAVPALENVVLWHERDISNSSVERVVLPDASTLVDYMLGLFTDIVSEMRVRDDRMAENLALTRGLLSSERALLALVDSGMTRPDAYAVVQDAAMRSWQTREPLREILETDERVRDRLSTEQLDKVFEQDAMLGSTDTALRRVGLLGPHPPG